MRIGRAVSRQWQDASGQVFVGGRERGRGSSWRGWWEVKRGGVVGWGGDLRDWGMSGWGRGGGGG